jgi:hypothetical protein
MTSAHDASRPPHRPTLIRVGVTTFQRPAMLARALASLRAQTHHDWIATVYNDDPDDLSPARLVVELGDSRIACITTPARLGPVRAFNAAYTEGNEPYFALLEDDNTWDPDFLARLHTTLAAHPSSAAIGCHQRIMEESSDGTWRETGTTVRATSVPTSSPSLHTLEWGVHALATGATLSNGALLVRRSLAPSLVTPEDLPFAGVEAVRQRLLPHPLLYLPETLASFAQTRTTARAGDGHRWGALQTLLLATFVRHARLSPPALRRLWNHWRRQTPAPTHLALHAGLSCPGCRHLLAHARVTDWLRFARTVIGRPAGAWACLRARKHHAEWWSQLDRSTALRFAEATHG